MKVSRYRMLGISAFLLIAALAASSAVATPYIKYGNDGIPIFGALIHYSNVSFYADDDKEEFRGDPINGSAQEDAAYTLNSIVGLRFSGNDAGVSGNAVTYGDSILYAQAISDTINAKGVGLVDGTQDGGWGMLEILGKATSERNDLINHPNGSVRSYTEATADAYLTFKILDDNPYPGEKVLVKFVIESDLHFEINEVAATGDFDRYVNFATFGGLIKQGKPDSTMKFNLSTDDTPLTIEGDPVDPNNPDPLNYFVTDNKGKLINLIFDDPARPDQYDAGDPYKIVDLVKGEADCGRGGFIPEPDIDVYGTTRSWPDTGSYLDFVNLDQVQELLLDDPLSPANDPGIANDPQFSVGNETFNAGQLGSDGIHAGSRIWYFWADINTEYAIYCQLSANIATDGGINGQFGSLGDVTQLSKLYYHLEIAVPEPATIIMIGLSLTGLTAILRKKFKR